LRKRLAVVALQEQEGDRASCCRNLVEPGGPRVADSFGFVRARVVAATKAVMSSATLSREWDRPPKRVPRSAGQSGKSWRIQVASPLTVLISGGGLRSLRSPRSGLRQGVGRPGLDEPDEPDEPDIPDSGALRRLAP